MKMIMTAVFLVAGLAAPSRADDGELCAYVGDDGAKESITLIFADEARIVRARFAGDVPDRYFARTGVVRGTRTADFTQFATKASAYAPLALATDKSSRFELERPEGGNRYRWVSGGKAYEITCAEAAANQGSPRSRGLATTGRAARAR